MPGIPCLRESADAGAQGRRAHEVQHGSRRVPGGEAIRHDVPKGYDEAATHPESAKLWEATIREYEAHIECGT